MVIEFLCPNGHRIHCDSKRSGLAAKCPRCGQKFRVPTPEELESAEAAAGEGPSLPPGGDPSLSAVPASAIGAGPAVSVDQIEFLCPNNHLIHAPAQLQGKPGHCPQCGSAFRVPIYDEPSSDEGVSESMSVDVLGGSGVAIEGTPSLEEPMADLALDSPEEIPPSGQTAAIIPQPVPGPPAAHPFFEQFCRLWSEKVARGSMEVHYGEGHHLTPDRFAKGLSAGSHAVFAVDEPGGTYVVTTIPWHSITAVVLRGVKSLPAGMET